MSNTSASLIQEAAEILVHARRTKTKLANLPERCRPTDNDADIAIQFQTLALLNEPIAGWKAGVMPNPDMIMLAPIPQSGIFHKSPVTVLSSPTKIEPEIAFVLAHDIVPRSEPYSDQEILDAIGDVRFVLELLGSRFEKTTEVTHHELLADAFQNYGLFVGPSCKDAMKLPLESRHVRISGPSGDIVNKEGKHPSGHPLKSFAWLINYLAPRGHIMKAGEIVTTGSYAGIVEVPTGVPLRVEMDGAGVIDIEFAAH